MTPPSIPPIRPPESVQTATIIVEALNAAGHTACIHVPGTDPDYEFDIIPLHNNVVVGSRLKNRSYLTVTWYKKELGFETFGRRWSTRDEIKIINLADPNSMTEIADYILKVATEDKFRYPFI